MSDHKAEPVGCGCWTVCSCGWRPDFDGMTPEEYGKLTPMIGRQMVDRHVAEATD